MERGEEVVERERLRLAVDLSDREAHRDAHEEDLRQLDPRSAHMQEVAVDEGLQAQIVERHIPFGLQRGAEAGKVEAREFWVDASGGDAGVNSRREGFCVAPFHLLRGRLVRVAGETGQNLTAQLVHQEPGAGTRIVRLALLQRAGGHDRGECQLGLPEAVVEVAARLGEDHAGIHPVEAPGGFADHRCKPRLVERDDGPVTNVVDSVEDWPTVGWETIARADPTIIAVADLSRRRYPMDALAAKVAFLKSDPVTSTLGAVRNDRIVPLDPQALNPTTRVIDGLESMASVVEMISSKEN